MSSSSSSNNNISSSSSNNSDTTGNLDNATRALVTHLGGMSEEELKQILLDANAGLGDCTEKDEFINRIVELVPGVSVDFSYASFQRQYEVCKDCLADIKDAKKPLAVIIGNTGAGKTSLINYLLGVRFELGEDENGYDMLIPLPEGEGELMTDRDRPDKWRASTSLGLHSDTMFASVWDTSKYTSSDYRLVDTPGYLDNRSIIEKMTAELSNALLYDFVTEINLLVFVTTEASLYDQKGDNFREMMENIAQVYHAIKMGVNCLILITKPIFKRGKKPRTVETMRKCLDNILASIPEDRIDNIRETESNMQGYQMAIFDPLDEDTTFDLSQYFPKSTLSMSAAESHVSEGTKRFLQSTVKKELESMVMKLKTISEGKRTHAMFHLYYLQQIKEQQELEESLEEKKGTVVHNILALQDVDDILEKSQARVDFWEGRIKLIKEVIGEYQELVTKHDKSDETVVFDERASGSATLSRLEYYFRFHGDHVGRVEKTNYNRKSYTFSENLTWKGEHQTSSSYSVTAKTGRGVDMDCRVTIYCPYNETNAVKQLLVDSRKKIEELNDHLTEHTKEYEEAKSSHDQLTLQITDAKKTVAGQMEQTQDLENALLAHKMENLAKMLEVKKLQDSNLFEVEQLQNECATQRKVIDQMFQDLKQFNMEDSPEVNKFREDYEAALKEVMGDQETEEVGVYQFSLQCSRLDYGTNYVKMVGVRCHTCNFPSNAMVCRACFSKCHDGHEGTTSLYGKAYCDCCDFGKCQIGTDRPCTFKETEREYTPQLVYQCETCKITDGKCVCVPCAHKCHKDHKLKASYSTGAYCDCPDMYPCEKK